MFWRPWVSKAFVVFAILVVSSIALTMTGIDKVTPPNEYIVAESSVQTHAETVFTVMPGAGQMAVYPQAISEIRHVLPGCPKNVKVVPDDEASINVPFPSYDVETDTFVVPGKSSYERDPFMLTAHYLETCITQSGLAPVYWEFDYAASFLMVERWIEDPEVRDWGWIVAPDTHMTAYEFYVTLCSREGFYCEPMSLESYQQLAGSELFSRLRNVGLPFWYDSALVP